MKILFLLPPSEGKNTEGTPGNEVLTYQFEKPNEIAVNVTEKDLKCTGNRYEEGINLNKNLCSILPSPVGGRAGDGVGPNTELNVSPAISRYTGVMFNAIDYAGMSDSGKNYFAENFLIFSGMYGIVKPNDTIGNYKLPIETKGLAKYWKEDITQSLNESGADYIVNLLPLSYQKMIDFKTLEPRLVNINFLTEKNGKIVKVSHGVKKIKGQWINNISEEFGNKKITSIDSLLPLSDGLGMRAEKIETQKVIEINLFA